LDLTVEERTGEMTVWDRKRNHRLMIVPGSALFSPVLNGSPVGLQRAGIERKPGRLTFRFRSSALDRCEVEWRVVEDHIEISSRFTATADCELNRLDLLPAGTALNLYDVVNFRNRLYTTNTWQELNLGGPKGCETDTYSTDWQFTPHPTMFILRKHDDHLFFGALDLPKAFGMYFKAAEYRVQHWYLDCGQVGFGLKLRKGERFASPRFCLFLDRGRSVHETVVRWTELLIKQGLIPDPKRKRRHAWHTENLYCTWTDQCARAQRHPPPELKDQVAGVGEMERTLDQNFVREALSTIRREKLPFRSFLLDSGWQVARGQWEPDPRRFPDLRQVVDEIHAAGLKAIAWWAWPEIAEGAKVDPAYLIAGGKRNRHGSRMWDYSNLKTQREYLEPLFHRLMSADPGCYDLDGLKTDFTADKVHADMPVRDPAWHGEENYFHRLYEMFHGLMRRHKPDACHIGCAGHPYLAEFIEVNRTFDVFGADFHEHLGRGLMLQATTPGCPVALDFHNYIENWDAYFALGRRQGWSTEVGSILSMQRDMFAPWEAADQAMYALLRRELKRSGSRKRT
jgi:hypothetical protein